jgi:hypothetical protein
VILTKTFPRVRKEMSIPVPAQHLRRAVNILGVGTLLAAMRVREADACDEPADWISSEQL